MNELYPRRFILHPGANQSTAPLRRANQQENRRAANLLALEHDRAAERRRLQDAEAASRALETATIINLADFAVAAAERTSKTDGTAFPDHHRAELHHLALEIPSDYSRIVADNRANIAAYQAKAAPEANT